MSVKMKYGATEGLPPENVQIDILWSNESPTSNFAAQTISLELSTYRAIAIVATASTSDANGGTAFGVVNDGITYNIFLHNNNANAEYTYVRSFKIGTSGITFGNGLRGSTAGAQYAIPRAIYGVRF